LWFVCTKAPSVSFPSENLLLVETFSNEIW
jgi:hypothetical protein